MFLGKQKKPQYADFEKDFNDPTKLTQPIKRIEEKWKLVPAFLKTRGLQKHQIASFNQFINHDIKKIIRENSIIRPDTDAHYFWEYMDIRVDFPTKNQDMRMYNVTPQECRLRNLTYSGTILVDVRYTKGRKLVVRKNIRIGEFPIMLQSCRCHLVGKTPEQFAEMGECPLDPGGYFILKGVEKVVLIQEQMSKNRILVDLDRNKNVQASCTSWREQKSKTYVQWYRGKMYLKHNIFSDVIPIVIIFRAMGVESDLELMELVGSEQKYLDAMIPSLQEADTFGVFSSKIALRYLGKKIKPSKKVRHLYGTTLDDSDQAREVLAKYVISHIPVVKYNYKMKVVFLSFMLRRMIEALHDRKNLDDKDYYGNKRLELAGSLLGLLFEDLFKSYNTALKKTADRNLSKKMRTSEFDITHFMDSNARITLGLAAAIKSGNWHIKRFHMDRQGVTRVLSRLSFMASLSQITRIKSQFEKTMKVTGPRALQTSQWGCLCPSDTPEGESCGLIKNLALLAHITTDVPEDPIIRISYDLGVEDIQMVSGREINANYPVFINGLVIGVHPQPDRFLRNFKLLRQKGKINEFVSITKDDRSRQILVSCEGGRLCRPLVIVDRGGRPRIRPEHLVLLEKGVLKFGDFIKMGVIEYLDINEQNNAVIALKEKYINSETTHLEIESFAILGVCVGLIPYPHHNQSPRNTYQCAMGKQAMGALAYNQFNRMDTLLYFLVYPQKPLVKTKVMDILGFEKTPAGQNAVVAVMSYSGYDIEDALLLNRASLDRGYGRCIVHKTFNADFLQHSNQAKDIFNEPSFPPNLRNHERYAKYQKVDRDGLACQGERVKPRDVLIMKYVPKVTESDTVVDERAQIPYKDAPTMYKSTTPGYVSQMLISSSDDYYTIVKCLMRNTRTPELGDKFSSRHGQKGVCGLIVPQEDLPFNDQGICPDLIMNPHGFPSRMTVGKILEFVNGKSCVVAMEDGMGGTVGAGRLGEATAFGGDPVEKICKGLVKYGYSYSGKEYLTSGETGDGLQAFIFFGPVHYQKLKHMVLDKVHARSRGPRAGLTRQPTTGRSREGGLRLGEMERDCLVGYGASRLLIERFVHSSDKTFIDVCEKCGMIGYKKYCVYCKSSQNMHNIRIPYACKLLFQELLSMNVFPKLELSSK